MIRVAVTGAAGRMGREVVKAVTSEPDMSVAAAVDTGAPMDREITTCLDVLLQTQRVISNQLTNLQLLSSAERLDGQLIVIQPDVGWIRMFDFEHTQEAIQAGREAVQAHLDAIVEMAELTTS